MNYCVDYYVNYYCDIPSTLPTGKDDYKKGQAYRYEMTLADSQKKAPNAPNTTNLKVKYDPWVNCFCSVTTIAIGGILSFILVWALHYVKAFGTKAFIGPKD